MRGAGPRTANSKPAFNPLSSPTGCRWTRRTRSTFPRNRKPFGTFTARAPRRDNSQELSRLGARAVKVPNGFRFLGNVERVRRVHLHPVGELKGLNAGFELAVLGPAPRMLLVQLMQQI